jgi:GT2 family glycosyltransferase
MAQTSTLDRRASGVRPAGLVGVILVNWNGWQHSLNAYESLRSSTYENWVLIVVDNASADDSLTHLRALGPDVHLIESKENLGFAGGCNLARIKAEALGVDYLFLMNNDSVVTPQTIEELVRASESLQDKAILGSVVRYQSGELQFFGSEQSKTLGYPVWRPASEEQFSNCDDLIPSDFIFGAALFVPIPIFKIVGAFDERFFLNFEETDWCYRARSIGFDCFVVKRAMTFHKGSASLGSISGPMQIYFLQRNELLFCEKNVSFGQLIRVYRKALRHSLGQLRRSLGLHPQTRGGFEPGGKARLLAVRDYVLRRFGDCPPIIRKLAEEHGQADAAKTRVLASSRS